MDNSRCPICDSPDIGVRFAVADLQSLTPGEYLLLRCGACAHEYIHPRPDPEQIAAFYTPGYWSDVDTDGWGGVGITVGVRRLIDALWREHPGGRVLDVGCGAGKKTAALRERGFEVLGLEPYEEACRAARESHGLEVVHGFLADAPLPQAALDAATFLDVLEHVHDPVSDLRRVRSLLKPGGTVAIKVPNIAAWQARRMGKWWVALAVPWHLHHFSPTSLRRALEVAGFERIQCGAIPDPAGATTFEVSMLLWLRGLAWRRGGGEPAPTDCEDLGRALEGKVYPGVSPAGKRAFRWFLRNVAYAPLWPENYVGRSITLLATARA